MTQGTQASVCFDHPRKMDLRIRPIRPEDKALLSWGLTNLSEASVHRRFLAPKPRFTAGELR